jgi:hypothetical protein
MEKNKTMNRIDLFINGELNKDYMRDCTVKNNIVNKIAKIKGTYWGNKTKGNNYNPPIRFHVLLDENKESDWNIQNCTIVDIVDLFSNSNNKPIISEDKVINKPCINRPNRRVYPNKKSDPYLTRYGSINERCNYNRKVKNTHIHKHISVGTIIGLYKVKLCGKSKIKYEHPYAYRVLLPTGKETRWYVDNCIILS